MKLLRQIGKLILILLVLAVLAAFIGYFYFDSKLNPYDGDSYSPDWKDRFEAQARAWEPVEGHLMTRWASDVSPDLPWPEYPRPQMSRQDWLNLNGVWEFAVVQRQETTVNEFPGRILVPYPIESALSGVKQPLLPGERLWYRRKFTVPENWQGRKVLLHFGAVDWEAQVWLNGNPIGSHQGGYDPFSFEISGHLKPGKDNELVVAVWDPTDVGSQERGKQRLVPFMAFYTAASGIWQTVWLEPVPHTYIERLKITPDIDAQQLSVEVAWQGETAGMRVVALAFEGRKVIAAAAVSPGQVLRLEIPKPKLWDSDSPYLYGLRVWIEGDGQKLDEVHSYFGMRSFNLRKDARGIPRLFVNSRPQFQYGPLDQGYWPDGVYTAPTDAALRYDIEMAKKLGFNMIRKHVKVEPARWYYHCDKLGMIVWQDMPSAEPTLGSLVYPLLNLGKRDDDYASFGREDSASRENYRRGLQAIMDALQTSPSVAMWIPFNEGWGQFDAASIAQWIKNYDPSRVVNHTSGWFDQGAGDVKDLHIYKRNLAISKWEPTRAVVLGEFGGLGLLLPSQAWQLERLFVYDRSQSSQELTDKYVRLLTDQVAPLVPKGLAAAVYTQLTDVEGEVNGLLTYDRKVVKMDPERITQANRRLTSAH